MIFILIGIGVLVFSFAMAFISLWKEQKKVSTKRDEENDAHRDNIKKNEGVEDLQTAVDAGKDEDDKGDHLKILEEKLKEVQIMESQRDKKEVSKKEVFPWEGSEDIAEEVSDDQNVVSGTFDLGQGKNEMLRQKRKVSDEESEELHTVSRSQAKGLSENMVTVGLSDLKEDSQD